MIKIPSPSPANPEWALALTYAAATQRPALTALFALDDTLGAIVRSTREPIVGQMRLTWWYEALRKLDEAPPPPEPILRALYADVISAGVSGADLAAMTDGWEILLEPVLDEAAIDRFAVARGGRLFVAAGRLLSVDDPRIEAAGRIWALADLSSRLSNPIARTVARDAAARLFDRMSGGRWPKQARVLGAMALTARFDVSASSPPPGSPKRVGRLAWHRLTGY
ncbi:squalene/phytoene synthase family protein [Sphingomonas sp. Leaf38]|uniref:squalene/phytoene synthase family protein n=1 Tax=Sphingomonas sp. Leaf38 TaxID=1736217 RepID=UPI0006FAD66A|nr:squalene/phytoene synthase family protein [Sphingomonas sp. Leaf38]KQN32858.1 hypothetical protein ASE88_02490 [Sphingomonas sp. Leaf38]